MKKFTKKIGGFTLVEVLIASTIFTIVSIMATNVFVSVVRIQNRIILENQIYEDARFMMERIAREVRNNTIDYEEYYRKTCLDDSVCAANTDFTTFGSQTGCYAQRFYNPGTPLTLGAVVNADGIVDKTSLDINTGQNPYTNSLLNMGPQTANAVCDHHNRPNAPGGADCSVPALHERGELFLISADGAVKTFVGMQKVNTTPVEYAVAMLKMFGTDSTGDGVRDKWYSTSPSGSGNYNQCMPGFDCRNSPFPAIRPIYHTSSLVQTLEVSLEDISSGTNYQNFIWKGLVPITPLRTNITSLKFYLAPLEDPRKAFAESDPAHGILQQPHVTIVMTVQPADSELGKFIGADPPTLTLQSTVSSRTYREVKTYTGTNVCPLP